MSSDPKKEMFPYIHGFDSKEQERLYRQAEFDETMTYRDIDLTRTRHVLEVGCGVGAQSAILLRRFPKIRLTGIDMSEPQLKVAKNYLSGLPYAKTEDGQPRFDLQKMSAQHLEYPDASFDGAFLCWILEHVHDPVTVLKEVRRVLEPGGVVYISEVMNSTFFLDPYSPNTWKYWMAFNDYQFDGAGDPFVGAKLGNFLVSAGFQNVRTEVKTYHLDNRSPGRRAEVIAYWRELLLSASDQLVKSGYVTQEVVDAMETELQSVENNPDAVFFYSFMQARAET